MSEDGALRSELLALVERHRRGEVQDRRFERALAEKTVALYRALIGSRLAAGESVLAEHHVVHAHLALSRGILKEPEQLSASYFLTDRRLLRLRSTILPGRAPTADDNDGTVVDDVPLARITRLRVRREVRWGEVAVGAIIGAVALLGRSWLAVTGPILLALGVLGALHGVLLPTRWCEVESDDRGGGPVRITAIGRASGRALLRELRARWAATAG